MSTTTFLRFLLIALCLAWGLNVFAQSAELYSRARVWTPGTSITEVAALGICVDHGHYRKGVYLECDFSQTEITVMQQAGFTVDVLIEDVSAYYAKRGELPATGHTDSHKSSGNCMPNTTNYLTPLGFGLGSMAGFWPSGINCNHTSEHYTGYAIYPRVARGHVCGEVYG